MIHLNLIKQKYYIIALDEFSYKVHTFVVDNSIFLNPRNYSWCHTVTYDIRLYISNFTNILSNYTIEIFSFRAFLRSLYKDR